MHSASSALSYQEQFSQLIARERRILTFPHARLRIKASPVNTFDTELHQLIVDMFKTLSIHGGVGLAATQIDVHRHVLVTDEQATGHHQRIFINTELISSHGEQISPEGCLSVPEIRAEVKRFTHIRIRFQDIDGHSHEEDIEGFLAIIIQHECDHLRGKLFIDYLPTSKRDILIKKAEKAKKARAANG